MTHPRFRRRTLMALLFAPALAGAVTFDTNTTIDMPDATPGDGICSYSKTLDPTKFAVCTLRAAVMEGNATALALPVDIRLKPGAVYRFTIAEPQSGDDARGGDLDIKRAMKIATPSGTQRATIDANGLSRVFEVYSTAWNTNIRSVVLRGGFGDVGAAIKARAPTQLVDADIRSNFRRPDAVGFTFAIDGIVSLFKTTVQLNGTVEQPVGGLWAVQTVIPTIVDRSTIDHNTGAGIRVQRSTLILQNSTISSNQGLGIQGSGLMALDSDVDIVFSTLVNNGQATDSQLFFGQILFKNTLAISGSILDAHGVGSACRVLGMDAFFTGWNLYSDASCVSDNFFDHSLHNVSGAVSAVLSDAGGGTRVHVPVAGSPAIDRAPVALCDDLGIDQRGFVRPVAADGVSAPRCDIGAVEVQE